ncbi:MAG: HPr family phosphocarrier protein [Thermodesulfobacteriota bacterium]
MPECRKELVIANTFGLHGRAAAMLVETAKRFDADIRLIRDEVEADCKSILDVMSMACIKGTPIAIKAAGEDAEAALAALASLIVDKFGEE